MPDQKVKISIQEVNKIEGHAGFVGCLEQGRICDSRIEVKEGARFIEGILKLHGNKELRQKIHRNLLKKSNLHNREKFENRFFKLFNKLLNLNN